MPRPTTEDWVPDSVVRIASAGTFLGSGVLISPNLVLTCRHVVFPHKDSNSPGQRLAVRMTGREKPLSASILRESRECDLAILQLRSAILEVELPPWDYPPLIGQRVWATGFPANQPYNRQRTVTDADPLRIILAADVTKGISGGPARFTDGDWHPDWCCVGIFTRTERLSAAEAIPTPVIDRFLQSHGLELPRRPPRRAPRVSVSARETKAYLDYVRRKTGYISLISLGDVASGRRLPDEVELDRLWVPPRMMSGLESKAGRRRGEEQLASAVNQHRALVVEGEAGCGKSTFLKGLAQSMLDRKGTAGGVKLRYAGLPLWLPIREFEFYLAERYERYEKFPATHNLLWVSDYFGHQSEAHRWGLSAEFFQQALHSEDNLLLVDGLDEVRSPVTAQLFAEAATTFRCGMVLTLRPEAESSGPVLPHVKARFPIRELEDPEVQLFVRKWTEMVRAYDQVSAAEHEAALLNNLKAGPPAIRKMGRNPLMLTLLAVITRSRPGYRLPEQRAELYEIIVRWLAASQPDPHYYPDAFVENLSVLALHMTESRTYELGYGDAEAHLAGYLRTPDTTLASKFLRAAEERTRIIAVRGTKLSFWHRSFQEYLAARGIANALDSDLLAKANVMLRTRHAPEVLRLLAGRLQSIGARQRLDLLFRTVLNEAQGTLEREAWIAGMAGTMLNDLRTTPYRLPPDLDERYQSLLSKVLKIFQKKETAKIPLKTRVAAAEALGQAGDPRLRLPKAGLGDTRWREYWVEVPGGEFWMGAQKHTPGAKGYDPEAEDDEDRGKRNPVQVETFLMGKHPVTVYEYDVYLQAAGLEAPVEMKFEEQMEHPSRPLVNVTWQEACDYCQWAGGRLPSEEEWEYAARGPESWKYPWGNEPEPQDDNLANFFDLNVGAPTPVGLFPAGAQQETGVLDLSGNVWEWTSSLYKTSGKNRVLRGGSFDGDARDLRAADRYHLEPGARYYIIGFRCVREVFA